MRSGTIISPCPLSFVCFYFENIIKFLGKKREKSILIIEDVAMELVSPILVWFLLGIVFFVIELIVPAFILFFLGIGAWVTTAMLAVADIPLTVQMIVFLVSSLISLVILRRLLRAIFFGNSSEEDGSTIVHSSPSTGVVIEAIIPPSLGRVKYGGSFWKATAEVPIPVDAVVQIMERKNLVVQVCPLLTEETV
ncbi:NfeD family protein [Candidatus Electrothrix sp.]|uniref:NfeD family protein n=2 Tax=Candidatus Electrothrix sp. TaxID=2170559 RepID=UPI0040570327